MPFKGEPLHPRLGIPHLESLVARSRDNSVAVGAYCTSVHYIGMSPEGELRNASMGIPYLESLVTRSRHNKVPIGTHRTFIHPTDMSDEDAKKVRVYERRKGMPGGEKGTR